MMTKNSNDTIKQLLEGMSIQQFMNIIPGHFFIKNKEGVFIDGNAQVKQLGAIEKTDHDMPWKGEANQLRENDKKVMESKKEMAFIEKLRPKGKEIVTFYCVKAPLMDKNGNVVGIIGHAMEMGGK